MPIPESDTSSAPCQHPSQILNSFYGWKCPMVPQKRSYPSKRAVQGGRIVIVSESGGSL